MSRIVGLQDPFVGRSRSLTGPVLAQYRCPSLVSLARSVVEERPAAIVLGVRIRFVGQQHFQDIAVPFRCRKVQSRVTTFRPSVVRRKW
jgi:hypothetical protein